MNTTAQVTLMVSLETARKLWPKFRVRAWGDVTNHARRVVGLPEHVKQRISDGSWDLILLDCPSVNGTRPGDTRRRVIRARDGKFYTRCLFPWPVEHQPLARMEARAQRDLTGEPC
jgi:hypothetical protein